jgi:hypothetical protein
MGKYSGAGRVDRGKRADGLRHNAFEKLLDKLAEGTEQDPVALAIIRLRESCFDRQTAVIDDKSSKFISVCCSRRSGKTQMIERLLLLTALENPGTESIYFATTAKSAREIIWDAAEGLPSLIRELKLTDFVDMNDTKAKIDFKNGSIIYITGAETKEDAKRMQGHKFKVAVIDEAHLINEEVLVYLVNETLLPALLDWNGRVVLCGVPKPLCAGKFHDASEGVTTGWSKHHWTLFENPHLDSVSMMKQINEELASSGEKLEDAEPQRKYYGRWVREENAQLFAYMPGRNDYIELPFLDRSGNFIQWNYVLGLDIGFRDLTTFTIFAWTDKLPIVYCLESYGKPKMLDSEVAEVIKNYQARYNNLKIVADRGALGDFIFNSLEVRYSFYIEPAEKKEKAATIRVMNTAFRRGEVLLKPSTCRELAEQLQKLEMDPATQIEKKAAACDYADSMLYAWRHTYAYTYKSPGPKPNAKESWINREKAMLTKTLEENIKDPREQADKEMDEFYVDPWTSDFSF